MNIKIQMIPLPRPHEMSAVRSECEITNLSFLKKSNGIQAFADQRHDQEKIIVRKFCFSFLEKTLYILRDSFVQACSETLGL